MGPGRMASCDAWAMFSALHLAEVSEIYAGTLERFVGLIPHVCISWN